MKNGTIALSTTAAVLLATATSASAFTTAVTAGSFSSQSGATTIDFGVSAPNNSLPVAGSPAVHDLVYSGTGSGLSYDYYDGALYNIVTTPISGITARPVGSVGNYWSIGPSPAAQSGPGEVTFSHGLSYFGFLWGSPDGYNTVSFYNGSTLLGAFTGSSVLVPPNGDQSIAKYFNAYAGPNEQITRVTFSSSTNAFETDNHAFIAAIPEPETYAMMLAGLGLMGLVARRRKNML